MTHVKSVGLKGFSSFQLEKSTNMYFDLPSQFIIVMICVYVSVYNQADSQQTLRDLRLQFAEQISLLSAERKHSDVVETLFRGKNTQIG